MTKNNLIFLCEKIIEKFKGDNIAALHNISASVDAFLTLGQHENAEKMQKVLDFFRRFYV